PAAQAQNADRALTVIVHVDLISDFLETGLPLLTQFVSDSRKDPGCQRFEIFQQIDRTNHFTLIETWKDRAAFDAHEKAEHTKAWRAKLQPILASPFDERLHAALP